VGRECEQAGGANALFRRPEDEEVRGRAAGYNGDMTKSRANRREFLQGRAALAAAEDLLPEESPARGGPVTPPETGGPTYLVQVGRPAMACQFEILLNAGQYPGSTEAALAALDLVDRLEDQLTVYRPHSEVSQLSFLAESGPVRVEARLFALLQQAVELSAQTQGAFDITAGPLSKLWGFHRRAGRVPQADEIQATLQSVGSRHLHLDSSDQTVRFLRPHMEINLGAIGKGYALDRCAELLAQARVADYLIHGGQSSILACGSRLSAGASRTGWHVSIRHPLKKDRDLAEVWLLDRALGTSGSGQQFFHFGGRRYGHVIDPRNGLSVEGILSATVLAPTAALADALSTAFFVLGVERSLEYCQDHPELGVVFVCPGPRSGEIRVVSHGLAEDEFRQIAD